MFPYIREHISTVTQKAGIKPVLLAPINVLAMLRETEEPTCGNANADESVPLE